MSPLTPTADPVSLFDRGRRAASIGTAALVSLLAFEAMAVAAAMPAIAGALDGVAQYALAFGGMLATSVLGMVLAGVSADRHGPLRATALGLAVFTAGLLIAGLAPGMGWLVAGRVVQGLGAGMLGVTLYVGMGQVVPATLHPKLFALFAAAWVVPALVGPAMAALLVAWLGWRSVFLLAAAAAPLAAAMLLPAFAGLPRPDEHQCRPERSKVRIAWAAVAATGALLLHAAGQATTAAALLAALGVGLVAAMASSARLLPPGSRFAAPGLPSVIVLRGLLASSFASAEVFLPLHLTQQHGWSLTEAGLMLSAGALMWSAGSAVQARMTDGQDRRRALRTGFACVAAGTAMLVVQLATDASPWLVLPAWVLAGFGIGLAFPMLSVLTLALSPPQQQGRNASALQLCDAQASSAVLALSGALFNLVADGGRLGFGLVYMLAAGVALAGAILSSRAFAAPSEPSLLASEPNANA